ncbi:hypothetical protein P8452_59270 [Trifolium repens]|nr:hypothetical protein P8452_59270 [Trifolium repens]
MLLGFQDLASILLLLLSHEINQSTVVRKVVTTSKKHLRVVMHQYCWMIQAVSYEKKQQQLTIIQLEDPM